MPGKHLSRWTLVWFSSAMVMLIAACGLALLGIGGPQDWAGAAGLALVHLFALGWLCQAMMGALIQFVPVLSARPLALPGLALPAFLVSSLGTFCLMLGFLFLDGHDAARPLFLAAPLAVGQGLILVGLMVGATLTHSDSLRLAEVRMVLLALSALIGVWLSGSLMVLALAGVGLPVDLSRTLPLHMLLAIGGWLSLAAFGVSYKLFAMFLLAPETGGPLRRAVFLTATTIVALLLATLMLVLAGRSGQWAGGLALGLVPVLVALYLAEIARLWKSRRRPTPEVNMLWSRAALAFLGCAVVLALPAWRQGGIWAEAAVFVALVGWLSTLTLAQLIKIVSFLTWIQVFAPRIGHQPVPMVQKLGDTRAATICLGFWSAGTVACGLSLLWANAAGYRMGALLLLLGALGVARELIAIRRLSHLTAEERPARLPHLILPAFQRRNPAEARS